MTSLIITLLGFLTVTAYEQPASGVKFNHAAHFGERNIECVTCHAGIVRSMSVKEKDIPGHDVCSQCHSVENAPEDCKLCHINPNDPTGVSWSQPELIFAHKTHLPSQPISRNCLGCHSDVDKAKGRLTADNFPQMEDCFVCHDGSKAPADCKVCHSNSAKMIQAAHPPGWRHSHKFTAAQSQDCMPCHHNETFCSDCHAGDNLTGNAHNLNYRYNHGLDAKGKEFECQSCHDTQAFCAPCHETFADRPLSHTQAGWIGPRHGEEAERDTESCAACHSTDAPTCARGGCHSEGTGRSIHDSSIKDLDKGPWHDDPSFMCFQCHIDTRRAGVGFCGYCHGSEGE